MTGAGCKSSASKLTYLEDLKAGLTEMARYVFHYTKGNVQIRHITIDTTGKLWDIADIRILANSSYRPTAFIGGAVLTPTLYRAPTTGRWMVFKPVPIVVGRFWDDQRARCGAWSEGEGWRTLGHEWGHYALYLLDEYIELRTSKPQYCQSKSGFATLQPGERASVTLEDVAASVMCYHYTTAELSGFEPSEPEINCDHTPQQVFYGGSAWAALNTLFGWKPQLRLARLDGDPIVGVIEPSEPGANAWVSIGKQSDNRDIFGPAYLIQRVKPDDPDPQHIIGVGTIWPWSASWPSMRIWGIRPSYDNRVTVMAREPVTGQGFSGPVDQKLNLNDPNTISLAPSSWQPVIRVAPLLTSAYARKISRITGLRIDLSNAGTDPIMIAYCPAGGNCTKTTPMKSGSASGEYTFTLTFPAKEPEPYSYIYLRQDLKEGHEIVFWYQLAGGVGPAHSGGLATIAEAQLIIEALLNNPFALSEADLQETDLQVIYHPALLSPAPSSTVPEKVERIVDVPLRVQVVGAAGAPGASKRLRVRLNYTQDVLDRLSEGTVSEDRLVILERESDGSWKIAGDETTTQTRDPNLNWVSAPLKLGKDGSAVVALALLRP